MKYFMNHEKYSDPNILKKRCFSAVKLMISVVVYSAFTVLGFYSLAKANTTPSQFGGRQSMVVYRLWFASSRCQRYDDFYRQTCSSNNKVI